MTTKTKNTTSVAKSDFVSKLSIVKETPETIQIELNQNGKPYDSGEDQHNSNQYQTYGAVRALLQASQNCLNGNGSIILTTPLVKYTNEDANGRAGFVGSTFDGTPFTFELDGVTYSVTVPIEDVPDKGWRELWFGDEAGVLNVGGTLITTKDKFTRRKAYSAKAMRAILNGKNLSVTFRGEHLATGLEIKNTLMQATSPEEIVTAAQSVSNVMYTQMDITRDQKKEAQAAGFSHLQTGASVQEVLQNFDFTVPLAEGGKIDLATVSGRKIECVNNMMIPVLLYLRSGSVAERQGLVQTILSKNLKVRKVS